MTELALLELARGPALWFSLAVLAAGGLWRIAGILRLGARRDLSEPRSDRIAAGALRGIFVRMLPHPSLRRRTQVGAWNAYAYHVGLAILVFGYPPHIDFVRRLAGVGWPALPEPVVHVAVGITFVSMFLALLERLADPVRRLLSTFDDYFSWAVVLAPLLTGMMVLGQSYAPGAAPAPAEPARIALHLFSVELLFIWLPFGKLGHAFLVFASRAVTGAALRRRGADL